MNKNYFEFSGVSSRLELKTFRVLKKQLFKRDSGAWFVGEKYEYSIDYKDLVKKSKKEINFIKESNLKIHNHLERIKSKLKNNQNYYPFECLGDNYKSFIEKLNSLSKDYNEDGICNYSDLFTFDNNKKLEIYSYVGDILTLYWLVEEFKCFLENIERYENQIEFYESTVSRWRGNFINDYEKEFILHPRLNRIRSYISTEENLSIIGLFSSLNINGLNNTKLIKKKKYYDFNTSYASGEVDAYLNVQKGPALYKDFAIQSEDSLSLKSNLEYQSVCKIVSLGNDDITKVFNNNNLFSESGKINLDYLRDHVICKILKPSNLTRLFIIFRDEETILKIFQSAIREHIKSQAQKSDICFKKPEFLPFKNTYFHRFKLGDVIYEIIIISISELSTFLGGMCFNNAFQDKGARFDTDYKKRFQISQYKNAEQIPQIQLTDLSKTYRKLKPIKNYSKSLELVEKFKNIEYKNWFDIKHITSNSLFIFRGMSFSHISERFQKSFINLNGGGGVKTKLLDPQGGELHFLIKRIFEEDYHKVINRSLNLTNPLLYKSKLSEKEQEKVQLNNYFEDFYSGEEAAELEQALKNFRKLNFDLFKSVFDEKDVNSTTGTSYFWNYLRSSLSFQFTNIDEQIHLEDLEHNKQNEAAKVDNNIANLVKENGVENLESLKSSKTVLESSINSSILNNNNLKLNKKNKPNDVRKYHTSTQPSKTMNIVSGFIIANSKNKTNKIITLEYSQINFLSKYTTHAMQKLVLHSELKKKVASVNNDSIGSTFFRKKHTFLSKGLVVLLPTFRLLRALRGGGCEPFDYGKRNSLVKSSRFVDNSWCMFGQQLRSKSTLSINQRESVSKLEYIYNSDSPIFIKLLDTLINDPINETTQLKIEKFLQNQVLEFTQKKLASTESLMHNKISYEIKKIIMDSENSLEKLIINYKNNLTLENSIEKLTIDYNKILEDKELSSLLSKILYNIEIKFIKEILYGKVINIITNNQEINKDTKVSEVTIRLGDEIVNNFIFKCYYNTTIEYKKNNKTNITFFMWKKNNESLINSISNTQFKWLLGNILTNWMVQLKLVKVFLKVLSINEKTNILVPGDSLEKVISNYKGFSPILVLPKNIPMIVKPKLYKQQIMVQSDIAVSEKVNNFQTINLSGQTISAICTGHAEPKSSTLKENCKSDAVSVIQLSNSVTESTVFSGNREVIGDNAPRNKVLNNTQQHSKFIAENIQLGGYLLNDIEYTHEIFLPNWELSSESYILNKNYIYEIINYINSVPFKINKEVLNFILVNNNKYKFYTDLAYSSPLQEKSKLTKAEKKDLESFNSKKNLEQNVLGLALLFKEVASFYMPVRLDYRGRLYCTTEYLNYQGIELAKSLLLFGKEEKIYLDDEESINYLKIYGANNYGNKLEKKSFNDRIRWVNNNLENIINFENGVLLNKAENKLLFLSFCFEFKKYNQASKLDWKNEPGRSEKPYFLSNLPILFDASVNGFQHLTQLIDDVVLADKLNLGKSSWNDEPDDFYTLIGLKIKQYFNTKITDPTEKLCIEDRDSYIKLAHLDFFRSLIKKSIMTLPYNASASSLVDYFKEHFKSELNPNYKSLETIENEMEIEKNKTRDKAKKTTKTEYNLVKKKKAAAASRYIYKLNLDPLIVFTELDFQNLRKALTYVIFIDHPKLTKLLNYLIKIANVSNKLNIPIPWILPSGLVVQQQFFAKQKLQVKLFSYTKNLINLTVTRKDKININKQKIALMPNLVHSLDAASLCLVIISYFTENEEENINFFSVHDCYAVPCNKVNKIMKLLKSAYSTLYSNKKYLLEFDANFMNHIKNIYGENNVTFNEKNEEIIIDTNSDCIKIEYPSVKSVINSEISQIDVSNSSYILHS